ncbi:hypothetical protein [Halorubrum sp. 2020YC2]|uniref:hypothetical protein n=1 Tax=Halorubrum sp. 2020YC2 TaxID=2836432 RepID=UPI001BE54722|nr:hypothetical protein [Halorubrum sp. 2020YC2]QWC18855.1 hypothetical protein KI388_12100 [Halorubrum sp. 2020YC2]
MDRSRFVALAVGAFGLVFVSFLIRGTTRLVAPYGVAVAVSAPVFFMAAALLVALFVLAVLDATGIRPLE